MTVGATVVQFSRPWFGPEEELAVAEVLRSGWVVGGRKLQEFEKQFAARCGVEHGIGMSSWTTAAFLVLKSWGIGPGDEVIVPSLTFIASVNVIRHAGATPVFADIDPLTWNISPEDAARRITSRTKAILPVDQIGLPCDLPALSKLATKHGLLLLDDAACALGSAIGVRPVGSFGNAAVFSLHARKVITTGEGGMVVTNDGALAERLRRLRHQGMSLSDFARHEQSPSTFETYDEIGYNFRITDLQAAMGIVQMSRLDDILVKRAELARRYSTSLTDNPLFSPPYIPVGYQPNWQSYQVMLRDEAHVSRKYVLDFLFARGIPARRGVMASHLEVPYAGFWSDLPVTERVAARTLQLPLHPQLTLEQQDLVIDSLNILAAEKRDKSA